MAKNIVICCDGTGNEIKENQSNVLKLFRVAKSSETQITYYDPGVGTISESGKWSQFKAKARGVFGLITGYGLDDNVLDAYRLLIHQYKEGDRVYLFGFSRGAYTIRVLAGLVSMVGLLRSEQSHLATYALTAYKRAADKNDTAYGERFQKVLSTRRIPIRFMGCWDTVGSVIVPRPDRFYIPSLESLPYTEENPSVQVFRHAMAINEKRRMFRLMPWNERQVFKPDPLMDEADALSQDIKQVWFSGVHSDVGGGYSEEESGAAKIALAWMLEEAITHGLKVRQKLVKHLVYGHSHPNGTREYMPPDPNGMLHESLAGGWHLVEWIPKNKKYLQWKNRRVFLSHYLPRSEPRPIANDADIHPSVQERTHYQPGGEVYQPENLPGS